MSILAFGSNSILDATTAGKAILTAADASAQRSLLGLGTLATQNGNIADYLTIASAAASYQPLDADLTAISAVATQSFGRSLLAQTSASALKTTLGLGTGDSPSFTALTLAGQSLTGSADKSLMDLSTTWNTTGTPSAVYLDVTDVSSNSNSLLVDLRANGITQFNVRKDGRVTFKNNSVIDQNGSAFFTSLTLNGGKADLGGTYLANVAQFKSNYGVGWNSGDANTSNVDLLLYRDAAGILAQRNGVNAQAFRLYNTYTDASNYERGKFAWESNALRIGTEKLGTGAARDLHLQTDGAARMTILSTGNIGIGTGSPSAPLHVSSVSFCSIQATGSQANTAGGIYISNATPRTLAIEVPGATASASLNDAAIIYGRDSLTKLHIGSGRGTAQTTFDLSSGHVGIGTTAPTSKLHIVGGISAAAGGLFAHIENNTTGTATVGIKFSTNYGSIPATGSVYADFVGQGLIFQTIRDLTDSQGGFNFVSNSGTTHMVIRTNSGNVGIGTTAPSVKLDIAGTTEIKDGVNAQTFRVYNTYTDASNYERGFIRWDTNVLQIGTEYLGTGTSRQLRFVTNANTRLSINANVPEITIGSSGSNAPGIFSFNGSSFTTQENGRGLTLYTRTNVTANEIGIALTGEGVVATSGLTNTHLLIHRSFIPTSGTGGFNFTEFRFTVNQTGGANGTTRGLYINPTLTSAANWRAIESLNGPVVLTDTYAAGSGSLAGSLLNLNQTWNTTGTPTAISLNVTDTASDANSYLMNLQVGGAYRFRVTKAGTGNFLGNITSAGGVCQLSNFVMIGTSSYQLHMYNATNPMSLFPYNTYIDASNYERGKFAWESNVLRIGTEKAGTGSARALELQTDGITRITFAANGAITTANSLSVVSSFVCRIAQVGVTASGSQYNFDAGTASYSGTSGDNTMFMCRSGFNPASGTMTFTGFAVTSTINQTGGASGITRGIHINPTLTAAADWRAIEVSAGKTILAASTTGATSLNIPAGSDPTSPNDGDIWFDGTNLKIQVGGVTKTFMLSEDYNNLYIRP